MIRWSWPAEKSPQLVELVRHLISQMNQQPPTRPSHGQGGEGFGP